MVWADLNYALCSVPPRQNHSLTAVAPRRRQRDEALEASMPTKGHIYLYGGDDGRSPRHDLWVYDISTERWEEILDTTGQPPSARSRHTATLVQLPGYDYGPDVRRIYIFGGIGIEASKLVYLDVERHEWVHPRTIGLAPPALLGHSAEYTDGGAIFVFGGRDARRAYNGVWRLDVTTHEWSEISASGSPPPPTSQHVMIADGHRLIIALGELPRPLVYIFDTKENTWLQASTEAAAALSSPLSGVPGGHIPSLHTAAAARIGAELHVFGGVDTETSTVSDAMWILDLRTLLWHHVASGGAPPSARRGHAMCSLDGALFLYGGLKSTGAFSSGFRRYDAAAIVWDTPRFDGNTPGARLGHTMSSGDDGKVYLFGGAAGGRPLSELHLLDLNTSAWERLKPAAASRDHEFSTTLPPLVGHAACCVTILPTDDLAKASRRFVGKKMLVLGGGNGRRDHSKRAAAEAQTLLVDLEAGDPVLRVPTRGAPPYERVGHAVATMRRGRKTKLYVFGGYVRGLGYMFDIHVLDVGAATWAQPAVGGSVPDGRVNHSLCAHERRLYSFGGAAKGAPFSDLHCFDVDAHSWSKLTPVGTNPPGNSAPLLYPLFSPYPSPSPLPPLTRPSPSPLPPLSLPSPAPHPPLTLPSPYPNPTLTLPSP